MIDAPSLRDSVPRLPAVVLAALLAVVLIGERLLWSVVDSAIDGGGQLPWWLPQSRMLGETVVFYATFFDLLTFVAVPAVLFWFAYVLGRRHGAASES